MMKVIEGENVDLLSPFPLTEIKRAVGWMHCYRTLVTSDDGPQSSEEITNFLTTQFQQPNVMSWGIIDKNQKLNIRHEAPLIGFVSFEQHGPRNGYFHIATTRKAWGSGMVDEAAKMIVDLVFTDIPTLLRVSSMVINNNYPARALAKRLGFSMEGVIYDAVLQNGEPKPLTHFGLTRRKWNELCQSPQQSLPSLDSVEQPSVQ